MKENISVNEAIRKGKWMINVPAILLMFGLFFGGVVAFNMKWYEGWIIAVGAVLGFLSAWLYWSYAITKWRIWAFENVRNVHELKRKAIQNNLIWADGSWAEKTEIRSYEQKQQLKKIERKFLEKDIYHDDLNIPKETQIFFSKSAIFFPMILGLVFLSLGICFGLIDGFTVYYVLILPIGGYLLFLGIKKMGIKEPQLVLNSNGIKFAGKELMNWKYIDSEFLDIRRSGKQTHHYLVLNYHHQYYQLDITDLNTNFNKLEHLLQVYRVRYEKNKAN